MKNRTENISVRYRPQHLTKSPFFQYPFLLVQFIIECGVYYLAIFHCF